MKMDVKTEKKKGKVCRSPDDPDRRPDDPASAWMIRTPARTIRIMCPATPEATSWRWVIRTQARVIRPRPDAWTRSGHPALPQLLQHSRIIRTPTRIIRTPEAWIIRTNSRIIRPPPACMTWAKAHVTPPTPRVYIYSNAAHVLGLSLCHLSLLLW